MRDMETMTRRIALALSIVCGVALAPTLGDPVVAQGPDDSALADLKWRNLGPGSASGRIVDIEALDADSRYAVAASASGGVWKTINGGITWTPIFDRYGSGSIGDVAIGQRDPRTIWVGTGEANNRNDVGWGDGIYKSTDGGATFTNVGLRDTYQIARIVLHPLDPNIAYVAAIGNLWGHTGERGLFKSIDGGTTWQKLAGGLPNDGKTGATDLVMDPANPNVLYVAFYERLRRAYRFDSGGPNGGIFKSTDGGRSWKKLTAGLPAGDTGRIGLAVSRKNPRVVMAMIEHGFNPPQKDPAYGDMTKLGTGVYRSEDGGLTWKYLNRYNNRPFYYSQIRINPLNDQHVYLLTTTFRASEDGGKTFKVAARGFSYDYHAMWLDPTQHDRYYLGQDKGLMLTQDHGTTFHFFENLPVTQYYAIGVDMRDPYYVYGGTQDNGSWGVPSFARDAFGIRTDRAWKLHWGDGMHAVVDPTDWRQVYSEAEGASFRSYNAQTFAEESRRPSAQNVANYEEVVGKRPGTPVPGQAQDPVAQMMQMFGRDPAFRFNWQSPLIMSPHNGGTLYLGGNYLFKTTNGGQTWRIISPDLSNNDPETTTPDTGGLTPDRSGAETYATIVSLSESAIVPGLLWAGTDDGNVWVTRNDGAQWVKVSDAIPDVPKRLWVSDVEASPHAPGTAYVTFDGHRSDNFETWVFKTADFGKTWIDLGGALPKKHVVHVLTADPKNPDLLYVGTEFGVQVTLDGGKTWRPLMNGMPVVAVHDLVVHPRDSDLVAGTHGRGIFVLDDITPLQQLTPAVAGAEAHLFEQRTATWWEDQSRGGQYGDNTYAGENPPSVRSSTPGRDRAKIANSPVITYWLGRTAQGNVTLQIRNAKGTQARTVTIPAKPGIIRYVWDGRFEPPPGSQPAARPAPPAGFEEVAALVGRQPPGVPAGPGTYLLTLTVNEKDFRGVLTIRPDPNLSEPQR